MNLSRILKTLTEKEKMELELTFISSILDQFASGQIPLSYNDKIREVNLSYFYNLKDKDKKISEGYSSVMLEHFNSFIKELKKIEQKQNQYQEIVVVRNFQTETFEYNVTICNDFFQIFFCPRTDKNIVKYLNSQIYLYDLDAILFSEINEKSIEKYGKIKVILLILESLLFMGNTIEEIENNKRGINVSDEVSSFDLEDPKAINLFLEELKELDFSV